MQEIFLMFIFIVKHFIVDFLLQTKYQYSNKGKYLHPGGLLHSFLHLLFTYDLLKTISLYVGMNYNHSILILSLIDGISHYHIDYLKVKICNKYNLKPDNSETYWHLLGLDQMLHMLIYCYIVYLCIV
jgi:hypothetical protein